MTPTHPMQAHPHTATVPSIPDKPRRLSIAAGFALVLSGCLLLGGCETPGNGRGQVTPATVRMPAPANDAEARFIGDIGSALRTRGWQPQPAASVPQAPHELRFAIRETAAGGFSSRIELLADGSRLASGEADAASLPAAMGEVAMVFDESLAAFQRSLARVPTPAAE